MQPRRDSAPIRIVFLDRGTIGPSVDLIKPSVLPRVG
jgi:hypothetical protein